MNTGHVSEGFPSTVAWASYALDSGNHNLPTYVAITDVRDESLPCLHARMFSTIFPNTSVKR